MKVRFFGATRTVTGSCFLVDFDGGRFLVDCGMYQGSRAEQARNAAPFPFPPGSVDFMILTHAHIDHAGLIPRLVREGFEGTIHTVDATADLCRIMLQDSAHIQAMNTEWTNRKRKRMGLPPVAPIYDEYDVLQATGQFRAHEYGESFRPHPQVEVLLHDAGHILGSSIVRIVVTEGDTRRSLVFSGDVGQKHMPIIRDPEIPEGADYLFMESTYGGRRHKSTGDHEEELAQVVRATIARGGNVVIPAFAVGRTQEILYVLNALVESGRLPPMPVFIDSPLAIRATKVFDRYRKYYDRAAKKLLDGGDEPLDFPGLQMTLDVDESRAINKIKGPSIIVSASGMAEAGRILHHLKHNLWRKECTVLIVGYQAQGTLGRQLVDGAKQVKIMGETIRVKASIQVMDGFSAHADHEGLLEWLEAVSPRPEKVFLVHGEERALFALEDGIAARHPGLAYVPVINEEIELRPEVTDALVSSREALHPREAEVNAALAAPFKEWEGELLQAEKKLSELLAGIEGWLGKQADGKIASVGAAQAMGRVLEGTKKLLRLHGEATRKLLEERESDPDRKARAQLVAEEIAEGLDQATELLEEWSD